MRLEDISAEIRPRGSWEAADLGWAMARENLPRLLAIFALTSLPLYALFGYFGKWWLLFAIWWLKPALDRPLLYFLSRKLFGAEPRLGEILKAWPKMLWQSIPLGLLLHRFSPSRSFTLPVRALEGLKGSAASDRTRLLGRYGDSSGGLLFACLLLWVCVWAGLLVFAYWFLPPSLQEDAGFALSGLFEVGFPPAFNWALVIVAALATMLTEPFYVAAGFGIYLNSRTHLRAGTSRSRSGASPNASRKPARPTRHPTEANRAGRWVRRARRPGWRKAAAWARRSATWRSPPPSARWSRSAAHRRHGRRTPIPTRRSRRRRSRKARLKRSSTR
ncbi:MAG: hypothetical protein R3F11_17030 [Verrucomicrobiales bacterium]